LYLFLPNINNFSVKKLFYGAFICLCGACVGFINGFMGAGGGILLVPILSKICGLETKTAHATTVLIILPICFISGLFYAINGVLDIEIIIAVGVGAIVGGIFGTFALKKLKSDVIDLLFYVIMIVAGIRMLF